VELYIKFIFLTCIKLTFRKIKLEFFIKGYIIKHLYTNDGKLFAQLNYSKDFFSDYAKHSHDMLSLSCLNQGKVYIDYMNDEVEILTTNKVAVFNKHQVHCSKQSEIKTTGYYTLYLDDKWCYDLQKKLCSTLDFVRPIDIKLIDSKDIYQQFLNICKDIESNNIDNHVATIENFISEIFKIHCNFEYQEEDNNSDTKLVDDVKQYILSNLENNISLLDIASYTGYHSTYISRIFKKEFGITPHAFMLNQKINISKKMLLRNNLIVDVASEAGFYD